MLPATMKKDGIGHLSTIEEQLVSQQLEGHPDAF